MILNFNLKIKNLIFYSTTFIANLYINVEF